MNHYIFKLVLGTFKYTELTMKINQEKEQNARKWDSTLEPKSLIHHKKKGLSKALSNVSEGSTIFVMPCGTGWLLPLLKALGYRVAAGNPSIEEIAITKHHMGPPGANCIDPTDSFYVVGCFSTNFKDNYFDVVILNQEFYSFKTSEYRDYALREFRRICSELIIIPIIFDSGINATTFSFKNLIRLRRSDYTVPADFGIINEEVKKLGLFIERVIPMQSLFSKSWYLILRRLPKTKSSSGACFNKKP